VPRRRSAAINPVATVVLPLPEAGAATTTREWRRELVKPLVVTTPSASPVVE
jgi:hypothetical protein